MSITTLPESRQAELKATLEAAAVPRWCNPALLSALLGVEPSECAERLASLRESHLTEPSTAFGKEGMHVPQETRRVLRRILATVEPSRFHALSLRTAAFYWEDPAPAARIEWIYHLLCGDSERGADELERLDHEWTERGCAGERRALATALWELEETRMVTGRARAWVLLVMAWTHELNGEKFLWLDVGGQALQAAREAGDVSAEAEASCLVGDARMAQFQFEPAEVAFGEFFKISQRLGQEQPDSAVWQRRLALAHSRMGDARQGQGRLDTALVAFTDYHAICRRAIRQFPADVGWRRELAVAHSKIGHVRRAQGQLERARAEFADYLAGFRKLVELDPDNIGWQRELGIACGLLASVRMALDGADSALRYYEESARVLASVVEKSPNAAQWAEDKRLIDRELAACRRSAGVRKRVKGGLNWLQGKMPF
jgi:tetratricopeptide (TPR) repeat protein